MTPLQIMWRVRRLLLQQFWKRRPRQYPNVSAITTISTSFPRFGNTPQTRYDTEIIRRAEAMCQGTFTFLNQSLSFKNRLPDWSTSTDGDKLWTFNLHYFDYTRDLLWAYTLTQQPHFIDCLIALILDWIDKNPFWTPIAWDSYPVSKRIIAWTTILGHLSENSTFQQLCLQPILASLYQQIIFLASNLEYDIDNNHLLTNARALLWGGIYFSAFPVARQWQQQGITLLVREAERQVLPDGGHCERSSSYQMVILQDLLETSLLLNSEGMIVPQQVQLAITKMFDFLLAIIKPDCTVPLLNDSVAGYPIPAMDLLAAGAVLNNQPLLKVGDGSQVGEYLDWLVGQTGRQKFENFPVQKSITRFTKLAESGYYVIQSPNDKHYVIFDIGPVGPRHSAAHAHADTLSIELVAFGQTLIVDPGVYEYKAGQWRDYFRSTAAHNTVVVDDIDQSSLWGSFRVAEMANARLIDWEETENSIQVCGEHDGYARLPDHIIHQRSIRYVESNRWEIVDTLRGEGKETHTYKLWFHLAPSQCTLDNINLSCQVNYPEKIVLHFQPDHPVGTTAILQDTWISYTWKQKIQAPALCYSLRSSSSVVVFRTTLTVERVCASS